MALDDIKELYSTVSEDIANNYLKTKDWRLLEIKIADITRIARLSDGKEFPMQAFETVYILGRYK